MIEKLVLVAGDCIYRIHTGFYETYHRTVWSANYTYIQRSPGSPQKIVVGEPMWLGKYKSSRVLRSVDYDPTSGMTLEEALYNAEFIAGYELRVRHLRELQSPLKFAVIWHNPHPMGTPEQKWFENGYYAAAKEERMDMLHKKELPDAKVEILLKLNEKLAAAEKTFKLALGEYGDICYRRDSPTYGGYADLAQQASDARKQCRTYKAEIGILKNGIKAVQSLA